MSGRLYGIFYSSFFFLFFLLIVIVIFIYNQLNSGANALEAKKKEWKVDEKNPQFVSIFSTKSAGLVGALLLLLFFIMRFNNSVNKIFKLIWSCLKVIEKFPTLFVWCRVFPHMDIWSEKFRFHWKFNKLSAWVFFSITTHHLICMQIINKMKIMRKKTAKSDQFHPLAHTTSTVQMACKASIKTKRSLFNHYYADSMVRISYDGKIQQKLILRNVILPFCFALFCFVFSWPTNHLKNTIHPIPFEISISQKTEE